MPPVHLPRYDHLAFTYIDPPAINTAITIEDVILAGSQLLNFNFAVDLDDILQGGPLHEQEHTIVIERHTDSDNSFSFDHEAFVTLVIRDFPLEP